MLVHSVCLTLNSSLDLKLYYTITSHPGIVCPQVTLFSSLGPVFNRLTGQPLNLGRKSVFRFGNLLVCCIAKM